MATLKDHQQVMVDLLAHGSAIPASAMRLAHAMHDVLAAMTLDPNLLIKSISESKEVQRAYTTPGLNDKALAGDLEACRPKVTHFDVEINLADMDEVKMTLQNMQSHLDGARDSQRKAERRVKELENTVNQLRASNAKLREERDHLAKCYNGVQDNMIRVYEHEQAGVRKDDTQVCYHTPIRGNDGGTYCDDCGAEL